MPSNLASFIQSKVLVRILKCFKNRNLASMYFKTLFDAIYSKRCIKANCLEIGELYNFIIYLVLKKSNIKKRSKWKIFKNWYATNRRIKFALYIVRWKNGSERIFAIIFSSVPNIVEHIFQRNDCYLCANHSRKEIRGVASYNREINVRFYFSSKFNLPRFYSPYCCPYSNPTSGSSGAEFRIAGHYISSKQSIYKFNRAMHCNWIRGVARQRRGVGNEYTFPFFFTGLPFPPYSFREKTESGRKNKNIAARQKRSGEKNHWTSEDSSEPIRSTIFAVLTFSPETLLARFSKEKHHARGCAEKAHLLPRVDDFSVDKDMEMLPRLFGGVCS